MKDKSSNNNDIIGLPAEPQLPNKLSILPIGGRPIFPGIFTPLMVNSEEDTNVIEDAQNGDGYIGIVMLKNDKENPTLVDLHSVGTVARIIKRINLPDGGINVFVSTIKRFHIRKILSSSSPMVAAVDYLDDEEKNKVLSDLFNNISILFCSYDLNKYDFEKKKTIRNNINYARCMEKYFNENNMYSESNSILKEIIVEMISYYANYKEFDTIDISLRGR